MAEMGLQLVMFANISDRVLIILLKSHLKASFSSIYNTLLTLLGLFTVCSETLSVRHFSKKKKKKPLASIWQTPCALCACATRFFFHVPSVHASPCLNFFLPLCSQCLDTLFLISPLAPSSIHTAFKISIMWLHSIHAAFRVWILH